MGSPPVVLAFAGTGKRGMQHHLLGGGKVAEAWEGSQDRFRKKTPFNGIMRED